MISTITPQRSDDIDLEIGRALEPLRAWHQATWQHSVAVGQWSYRLADTIGLPRPSCIFAGRCGELHDIGKLFTPVEILSKPGPLTASEWEVMRRHPADGAAILNEFVRLRQFADTVLDHHERLDGSGYPSRATGSSISVVTRIVAVADAFHAMIDHRTYQKRLSPSDALAELETASGRLWDPMVVNTLRAVLVGPTQLAVPHAL